MKLRHASLTLLALGGCWPILALAELQLLPDTQPQRVFNGSTRAVDVVWHNPDDRTADVDIYARIFQTSSSTAVPLSGAPWKKLEVLPEQTVVESARLEFPAVRAETKFLVEWLENSNNIIGQTEVWVYPTSLLAELKPLAGYEPLGVFDPQNLLKPLLANLKLNFTDLENAGLENFSGKLAIIGPFQSQAANAQWAGQRDSSAGKTGHCDCLAPATARKTEPAATVVLPCFREHKCRGCRPARIGC